MHRSHLYSIVVVVLGSSPVWAGDYTQPNRSTQGYRSSQAYRSSSDTPSPDYKPRKTVCWTDEKGVRACGDAVPARYAKFEQQLVNEQGTVVGTKAREKTRDEAAAEGQVGSLGLELIKREQQGVRYDEYLIQTFSSVDEIRAARDERLQTIDGYLAHTVKTNADGEKTLADLRARAAAEKKAGGPTDTKLELQIRNFEVSQAGNVKAADRLKQQRADTMEKYARDMERFEQLKAQKASLAGRAEN